MPPVAKKPRKPRKKPKTEEAKESTALVTIDPNTPVVIYMILDRGTGKVLYIGQSIHMARRFSQHLNRIRAQAEDSCLSKYCARRQRSIKSLEIKPVPGLPDGVAHVHADAFEAYFISKYDTVYSMLANPDGCNLTAGNHANRVDKDDIERQLEAGYVWPEPARAQVASLQAASAKLKEARLQEAVLTDLDARANTDPEHPIEGLAEALGEARLVLGRMEGDGLYEDVRDKLLPKYEALPPYAEVPRSEVVAALNGVSDRAKEADEELGKSIKRYAKALHLDHCLDKPLTANGAALMLRIVLDLVGQFAEAKLDLTSTNMQHWVAIRKWSAQHGGKTPSQNATGRAPRPNETYADLVEEQRLGRVINNWKLAFNERNRNRTGRPEEASVHVLVRDFPALLKAIATKAETAAKTAERDATCIALLKRGMAPPKELKAFPDDSEAEGLVPFGLKATDMSPDAFHPVRHLANHFVDGTNPEFVEPLRAAADDATKLTHARVARLVQLHEINRPALLAQLAASKAEGKKRKDETPAAGGATKGKKRKADTSLAGSSTDAPQLHAEDSDDGDGC
tara:strand:+ start:1286 stop:2992 length:1707 start_codon:yes stop_codon:yes gene_type:complete